MKKYHFSEAEFSCLENLRVPLAVYQFLDKRVITRVLSAGFCDLFDFETREQAYAVMTSDIYSTAHPDDASRVADAAYRFATQGGRYEVVYRVKAWRSSTYKIVHSIGEHVFTVPKERKTINSKDLFRHRYLPDDRRWTMVMTVLYSANVQYGLAMFEMDFEYFNYLEYLTYQLSAAVKIQELIRKHGKDLSFEVQIADPLL